MIDPALYLAFVAATVVLMLIPGPNVALIVANSVAHGTRFGLLTLAGTAAAMVLQLALVGYGLATALGEIGAWLDWLRWLGALYLVWLGMRQWRAPSVDLARTQPEARSPRGIFLRGLLVSLTNPKTLMFFGAFFPQFISPEHDLGGQVWLLSISFVAIAIAVDSLWATLAGRARGFLAGRGRLRNRLSGGFLIGAGVGLALARHK